jgi:type II secretory pathway component PulF
MDDEDITEADRPKSTLASKFIWLFVGAGTHLFLWSLLFTLLYAYVPRQKTTFENFGVAVSAVATAVIHLSDLVVGNWYLVVPLVAAGVIATDSLAVFLNRKTALRLTCLALLAIPPVVLLLASFVFPQHELSVLMEGLR